ncbi:MAG: hypothetical protein CMA27_03925 [Euryarchaeota archaeon]|nr:hypothetical protein [Euryarchaeota archaeon]|tara:strand:+ start:735 stop:947 length:213 start_codon:yes stop_codon:yes gene_type:complete
MTKKNEASIKIQLPNNTSKYLLAALNCEEVIANGEEIEIITNSLKELRSRWNTVMRTIEVSHKVLKKMEG